MFININLHYTSPSPVACGLDQRGVMSGANHFTGKKIDLLLEAQAGSGFDEKVDVVFDQRKFC